MDLIVTATSAAGQKVLDIMKVKPGCVITDVARPLDLSEEDVAKRPDVLVIESGEIELPGEVHMGDIGLPKGVAYACLAETVVLALEGRYETFTVGRNIEWEKVKEIYQLGLKHGMKLATISGVNGVFTEEDFARVRGKALAARSGATGESDETVGEAEVARRVRPSVRLIKRARRLTKGAAPAEAELTDVVPIPVDGLESACPRCGAEAGRPCITSTGKASRTHTARKAI